MEENNGGYEKVTVRQKVEQPELDVRTRPLPRIKLTDQQVILLIRIFRPRLSLSNFPICTNTLKSNEDVVISRASLNFTFFAMNGLRNALEVERTFWPRKTPIT